MTFGALIPVAAHAATPPSATTTTLTSSTTRTNAGSAVTFTTRVKRTADGAAINGHVRYYRQITSSSAWSLVTSGSTSSGVNHVTFKATSTYRWQARFVASSLYAASSSAATTVTVLSTFGARVVQEASRHAGAPYQWGATGPTRFDCSGFTRYVYGRFGKSLPHNSGQQYAASRHISRSSMRIGDLLFFHNSSGSIDHVAIYAGNGYMWAATHTGSYVKKQRIYSSSYYVGRV